MPVFITLTYAFILLLGVSISGYLSYEGLLQSAEEVTLPLVVLLMAIILILDTTISFFRSHRKRIWFLVLIWAVAAFFSISSNFNFLYSNFMEEDVAKNTVTEQVAVLRDNLVDTRTALADQESVRFAEGTIADLAIELDNLYDQINDPLAPGCGQECRSHMSTVEEILGREITNLRVPNVGSDIAIVNAWYQRYRTAAEDILNVTLETTQAGEAQELIKRVDAALLEFDSAERVLAIKGGLNALSEMSALSLDIERKANALLSDDKQVSHSSIDPTLGRLGEIVYAFQNGFGEMPNPMATFISLLLASLVDILPLLLSFALFGSGKIEKSKDPRVERGSGGRRTIGRAVS